mmetsp:Transcript_50350/g.126820  ORF Transcript_50350/g.126820 Transcript_50350/m.126820 type:complete len:523 (+) Transcript_50350:74-1642(+)
MADSGALVSSQQEVPSPNGGGSASIPTSLRAATIVSAQRAQMGVVAKAGQENAILTAVRKQMELLEDKLTGQIARVQQQGEKLRDAAFTRYDTKLVTVETHQPKLDRRLAELSGNLRGLSDEMQCQIRRIDQSDSRLWEWRHQIEEEIKRRLGEMEKNYQEVSSTVRVMKTTGDDVLKKYNQRLLKLESQMEECVVSKEDTNESIMQLHTRLTDVEGTSCERARDLAICLNPEVSAGAAPVTSDARDASDRVLLTSLDAKVHDLTLKMEALQSESNEFLSRVESQEERFKSLRTSADAKDEQFRQIGDRLEREDWEGRLNQIMSRIQGLDQSGVDQKEELQIMQNKLNESEQAHEELGNAVRRLQERGIAALAEMKLDESGELQAAVGGEEVAECTARLKECEDRVDALFCDVQSLRADQELGSRVATVVSSLKDIAPKVIAQDRQMKQLQEDLTSMNVGTSRHKETMDSLDVRVGRLEIEVERLVSEVEGVCEPVATIPEEEEVQEGEADDSNDLPEGFRK